MITLLQQCRAAANKEFTATIGELQKSERLDLDTNITQGRIAGPFDVTPSDEPKKYILTPPACCSQLYIAKLQENDKCMVYAKHKRVARNKLRTSEPHEVKIVEITNDHMLIHAVNDKHLQLEGGFLYLKPAHYNHEERTVRLLEHLQFRANATAAHWPTPPTTPPHPLCVKESYLQTLEPTAQKALQYGINLGNPWLAVEGPPGTGKTFLIARLALLLAAAGHSVGIIAKSHFALGESAENLLTNITAHNLPPPPSGFGASDPDRLRRDLVQQLNIRRLYNGDGDPGKNKTTHTNGGIYLRTLASTQSVLRQGTWTHLDVILVDEASQIPLFQLASIQEASSVWRLFGDTRQLPPILQAEHDNYPHDVAASSLAYIAQNNHLVVALRESRRCNIGLIDILNPLAYPEPNRQLWSHPTAAHNSLTSPTPWIGNASFTPLPVYHENRAQYSPEEIDKIVELVTELLQPHTLLHLWENGAYRTRPVRPSDIAISSPFRWQCSYIEAALAHTFGKISKEIRVGSVDQLQGKTCAIAIFSLATSLTESIEKNTEHAFSIQRWNVALSRARARVFVIYSPYAIERALPKKLTGAANLKKVRTLLTKK